MPVWYRRSNFITTSAGQTEVSKPLPFTLLVFFTDREEGLIARSHQLFNFATTRAVYFGSFLYKAIGS